MSCKARRRAQEALARPVGRPDAQAALEAEVDEESLVLASDGVTPIPQPYDADNPDSLPKRSRNLKDRSAKAHIAEWIRMRAEEPGITNIEVARRRGISPGHLSNLISKAYKDGWLKFDDPMLKLEHVIVPKIVRNLEDMLDAKSEKVTIEAAKGALFPMFRESKGVSEAPKTIIALKLELPQGHEQAHQIVSGTVVGTPKPLAGVSAPVKFIEGQVDDE